MKLTKIMEIKGKIHLESGLHIGSGSMEMRIGGTDNPVIKHPHTGEPYIPGSSIKGKVRSLLELASGAMSATGGAPLGMKHLKKLPAQDQGHCKNIIRLFGAGGSDAEEVISQDIGPTRVSFSDCALKKEWKEQWEDKFPLIEVKSENAINRISGTAQHPRFTERVPSGAVFTFSVTLKVLGEEPELYDLLLEGLSLLELDYLGGSGSRGYGRVKFEFDDPSVRQKVTEYRKKIAEVA
jgi:CRISPR-associated protein Csm3